jgi:cytochrome P450
VNPYLANPSSIFVTPHAYAEDHHWHEAASWLRQNDPICKVETERFSTFWALTRHADVMEIERQNDIFHNTETSVLQPKEVFEARKGRGPSLRTLINMDGKDHKDYRGLTADWFRPANMKRLEARIAELAKRYVDKMADNALYYPLHVIMSILGVPEADEPRMLKLTQELFGAEDPDVQRGSTMEDQLQVIADFFAYFGKMTGDRRTTPTEDLASVIANGHIDGAPLGDLETISYYVIVATAGHDTTSSSIAGGLEALAMHPEQLARLKADPSLITSAVDEMIRWTSPVKHFMRTATQPYTLSGHTFAPGDWLMLSYASANRDEAIFADPLHFDVGRSNADRHLAFGFGAHFCLGAQLARMEMRAFFAELLPRLDSLELAGDAQRTKATFVSGLKHLPLRYAMR